LKAMPIMGGAQVEIFPHSDFMSGAHHAGLFLHFSILAGYGSIDFTSTATTQAAPNITEIKGSALALLGKLSGDWQFTKNFSVFLEGGYRYFKTGEITPSTTGNGSNIFQAPTGAYQPVALNLSGLVFGAGLSAAF